MKVNWLVRFALWVTGYRLDELTSYGLSGKNEILKILVKRKMKLFEEIK